MAQSHEQTQQSVQQTRDVESALAGIASRMEAIKEIADHMAYAAAEQISVSQGVAQHVAAIADVAHETEQASRYRRAVVRCCRGWPASSRVWWPVSRCRREAMWKSVSALLVWGAEYGGGIPGAGAGNLARG